MTCGVAAGGTSTRLPDCADPSCIICHVQDGYVVQRSAGHSSWDDVRVHLLSCALDENGRYPQFVAVMRGPDALPKLLTRAALDELCSRLDAAAKESEASGGTVEGAPCTLQVGGEAEEKCLVWWPSFC